MGAAFKNAFFFSKCCYNGDRNILWNFNCLTITVHEIQTGDRRTHKQRDRRMDTEVSVGDKDRNLLSFGYRTLKREVWSGLEEET